jgi:hypothetical protein
VGARHPTDKRPHHNISVTIIFSNLEVTKEICGYVKLGLDVAELTLTPFLESLVSVV